jgi:hypothetical protein
LWVKFWDRVPYGTPNVKAPGKYEDLGQRIKGSTSDLIVRCATAFPYATPLLDKVLMAASPRQTIVAPPAGVTRCDSGPR